MAGTCPSTAERRGWVQKLEVNTGRALTKRMEVG